MRSAEKIAEKALKAVLLEKAIKNPQQWASFSAERVKTRILTKIGQNLNNLTFEFLISSQKVNNLTFELLTSM